MGGSQGEEVGTCVEKKEGGPGSGAPPPPASPPPPGVGGARAESAQPGRWMNVGENGDQDDRVRLGHVRGADGGKSSPPHPLPLTPGGNLRPPLHKAGPKLAAQEGRGRGILSHPDSPIFAIWGGRAQLPRTFALVSPTRRPRFAFPRQQPTPSRCTGGPPHPLLVGPFVLSPARPGTGLQASPEPGFGVPHCPYKEVANREPRTLSPSPYPDSPLLEEAVLVVVLQEHC